MANIYDFETPHLPPDSKEEEEPKVKRSRNRESLSLSPSQIRSGQRKLYDMVETAFKTLEAAMKEADFNNAVKAALGILDRTGFGPKSTLDINTFDLSELSKEELAERAERISAMLRSRVSPAPVSPTPIKPELLN